MIPRLFEKNETTFNSFGICPLADAIECFVTETRNDEFYLELTYPRDGRWVNEISIDRIILADPYDGATEAEPFRISSISYDMTGNLSIYAEHISYQLNYIIVRENNSPSGTKYPGVMWNTETSFVKSASNPFTFESDVVASSDRPFGIEAATPLRTILGGMEGSMLDLFGGEFRWNRYKVYHYASRGANNGVKIAYAKNLTGLTYDVDMSTVVTGVVAYFAGTEEYEESALQTVANNYSFSRDIVIDASSMFEELPTLAQLNQYASSYIASNAGCPSVSVTVQFVPLWKTEEYKYFYELEHVALCDTVEVLYPLLNLSISAKVVGTVYNVLADRYEEITISTIKPTLADTIVTLMKEI